MRVRFAPSPTGYLHIGNARTAVVNYLIARKYDATLVLRIEDTDLERSSKESEESIMENLRWLGISWDEGPDKGGDFGPYRQSERLGIYREYTDRLLASGSAYRCFCGKEETEALKKEAEGSRRAFRDPCRDLPAAEAERMAQAGKTFAVRFRVPENEIVRVKDHIKGTVEFNSDNIGGDFIIVRSDGMPVYNYIVIIDDALMQISHVIRGEDHLPNTPKQVLVARALGLPVPEYTHLALVLGPDRSKLSKRHGITSVVNYRDSGYLPEALVNYLAMLGWAAESGEEIFTADQIVSQIELTGLARSAAVFDFQKLKWMNGVHLHNYAPERLHDLFVPFIRGAGYDTDGIERKRIEEIILLLRANCELLADIGQFAGIFLDEVPRYSDEASAILREENSRKIILAAAEAMGPLEGDDFGERLIAAVKKATGAGGKSLFYPVRAMLTGMLQGPDLKASIPLIGIEACRKRIQYCIKAFCEKT
ncbi:MAG: glutamate--tRNA ligase [Spirochaetes bacterium]|nr:glutamate--tRNA ligase [Spirochaetota bacterium]